MLAMQMIVCKTVVVWSSPRVILPSSDIPKVQEARHARQFLWDGYSGSIFNWLHPVM